MISSTSNQQVKNIAALQKKTALRNKENCFIIEGIKLFSEVPSHRIIKSYVTDTFFENLSADMKKKVETSPYELVSDEVFKKMSDTVTPQGILTVVRRTVLPVTEIIRDEEKTGDTVKSKSRLFLLLEDINDPGNLGTILRTSEAAGVRGIIMSRNTVDIYNPKVVRSTMGAIFRMPFTYTESMEETIELLKSNGIRIYAAHLKGKEEYYRKDYRQPTAFIIGNESNGISEAVAQQADELIKIPMLGRVESLNAACAATILMYEVMRQNIV